MTSAPELYLWPEIPHTPALPEVDRALNNFPETCDSTGEILSLLEEVSQVYEEKKFGFTEEFIRKIVAPEIQNYAFDFSFALTPFRKDNTFSWDDALRQAGNSRKPDIINLPPEKLHSFTEIMAAARRFVPEAIIAYRGLEWDHARAVGWTLLSKDPNPYLALLLIQKFRPTRVKFQEVIRQNKPCCRLMTDIKMIIPDDPLRVACIANFLEAGEGDNSISFHEIADDCTAV